MFRDSKSFISELCTLESDSLSLIILINAVLGKFRMYLLNNYEDNNYKDQQTFKQARQIKVYGIAFYSGKIGYHFLMRQ